MVTNSRASLGPRSLRPLNTPAPIRVECDRHGRPISVRKTRWPRSRAVVQIQDCWRIDDEWWRERPISRLYYTLLLEDESLVTLYHDLISDKWFEQRGRRSRIDLPADRNSSPAFEDAGSNY